MGMLYHHWTNETKMRSQQRKMLPFEAGSSASNIRPKKPRPSGNGIAAETAVAAAGGGVIGSSVVAREHRRVLWLLCLLVSVKPTITQLHCCGCTREVPHACARLRARQRGDDSERSLNLAREARAFQMTKKSPVLTGEQH